MIFADVIVDISVKSLDRPFQYIVPEEMIDDAVIGAMVIIPFGSGNRELKGYIIGLSGEAKFDVERTKAIKEIVKQGVVAESHLLSLAYWIKENYGSTMNDAIKAVLPVRREIKKKVSKTVYPCQTRSELEQTMQEFAKKHNQARVRVLQALLNQEDFEQGIPYERLKQEAGTTMAVLHGLEEKEIVSVTEERQYRNPVMRAGERDQQPVLNDQQRRIVDTVTGDYRQGIRKTYLIHGVTGSGKTEVYMGIIEKVIAEHKQVIVLIPEIALTFQTVSRFYRRFGERVSVMHSRLSQGEKFDQFERAKAGDIDIMIGPRSALFTPFEHLGLIVIDEEHETSYQSEMPPKYHAREVAVHRASMVGASVILGSATPSLESYYRAQKGRYTLFTLTKRAGGASLPKVWVTDLREELERKNKEKEHEAFQICQEKIRKHELQMKLIDAEYTFDNNKLLFYFTADGRIDFRELVKDLAAVFKTRIELRQIGVRDETKILGGVGICGRPLCCHSYLSEFIPVSIKMAKEQNLSLNPTKISGVCGRLMCCLKYEEETYEDLNSHLPSVGDYVTTDDGLKGEVHSVSVLRQQVKVVVTVGRDEKEIRDYRVDQLKFKPKRRRDRGNVNDAELKALEALEKKEGKSKLDDN